MEGRKWKEEAFKRLGDRYVQWQLRNSSASPTERLKWLMREYELHNYGITSEDLTLGRTVSYIFDDGKYKRVEAPCRGYFISNKLQPNALPECHFERTKFEIVNGNRLSYRELVEDMKIVKSEREIALAAVGSQETTSRDMGDGESLLESQVETGFGSTTGVVPPVWMNMLIELTSLKAFMKNFVDLQPMPEMTFKFPLKNSVVEDDTGMQRTSSPTPEGSAGLDYLTKWTNYEINGWKYLRHAELTHEIREMLDKFLGVTSKYMEELAVGQAMLWDYAALLGMMEQIVLGVWRYPRLSGGSFTWTTAGLNEIEIPFGKAVTRLANAKNNYLFQDLSGGANDGTIYEPAAVAGTEFDLSASSARAGSGNTDEVLEGIMSMATLLKNKNSALEYVIFPDAQITERFFRDSRIANQEIKTDNPKFQDEAGFLGSVYIGGSSTKTDIWEAPPNLVTTIQDDTASTTNSRNGVALWPIYCGAYGKSWTQGVFTPFNMRVDEGFEVRDKSANVGTLRANETTVMTTSTKGSSWPTDYHHAGILWASLATGGP